MECTIKNFMISNNMKTFDAWKKTLIREDETIAKVYESYLNFKKNVSAYHEISEDAFVESRTK